MINIFSVRVSNNAASTWLLLARIVVGALMLTHGIPKLQSLLAGHIQFADPFGIGQTASLSLTVFAEVLCSILLIVGFATRLASIPLIINMAVAIYFALASQPVAKKELAIFYLLIYIGLLLLGGGRFSFDSLFSRKSKSRY